MPLYKIAGRFDKANQARLHHEGQLSSVRLGQRVQVHVDRGGGNLLTLPGEVRWVSSKAEFTPTPIQTRDERADLVYAVKIYVPNPKGVLKIGMPGDVTLTSAARAT